MDNKIIPIPIGDIGNYYGGLCVTTFNGKFYWLIENFDTDINNLSHWDQIDKKLYESLIDYEKQREQLSDAK